ncbi:helix-turn-helix domain-containing protein [Clostridium cochlearium]|uniref:helix-turn-helix domain-containing protein n=1 Tax=Clostridium cochlearium TaxID=1494 RepID=UPI0011BAA059|nr:helix-turn-helix domain-containing protein [Clostridium cochlearium]
MQVLSKKDFNDLKIDEQVNYINKLLDNGNTVTQACKIIGIARSTVGGRFARNNYNYNEDLHKYYKDNIEDITIKEIETENNDVDEILKIKSEILELVKAKKDIFKMLKTYKYNTSNDIPNELKDKIKIKTIKVYNAVYEEFNKVCNSYSSIKKQDLISLALFEFIQKYKK